MEQYMNMPLREARIQWEREYIQGQLDKHNKNISATARYIGMDRTALHRKMNDLRM
jgi:two-component system nitrogen regulation response regulator NtrX